MQIIADRDEDKLKKSIIHKNETVDVKWAREKLEEVKRELSIIY